MSGVRLTAKERILLHLADFAKFADMVEVPPEMAQDGIARAVGIHLQHVRQFIGPLLQDGLVRERIAHVWGHRRRLKVYDPTETGRLAAARLREQVRGEPIRVRDARGVREMTVGEALRESAGKAPFAGIVRAAMEGEVVDLAALAAGPPSAFVERLAEAPRLEAFVGRRAELETLTRVSDGPRLFMVRGVAGIGKSSLAAKACERLRVTRNLFWHRVRTWDTRLSILTSLADFLAATGRPGTRAVLARGEGGGADEVVRTDLPGSKSVLVFDDCHEATPEVLGFLRFLKDVIADAADVLVIVLSRRALPIYDRRDVALRGLVQEIDLQGLETEEIEALLLAEPHGARLKDAARALGGHPLFVELLRSAAHRGPEAQSLRDVRRFIEEEIYADLSEAERRMMKIAALYAVPFPRDAVFADPELSHDVLLSLVAKSLIRPTGDDAFGVHDTIRDFFASILTPTERQALAPVAVDQLLHLSEQATAVKDFVAALNCLSNALDLQPSRARQATLWGALGDTHERIGDLPAALAAYAEAARYTERQESVARLHRKAAAALQVRGEMAPAISEIEAGFQVLGQRTSVERGWLHLLLCGIATDKEEFAEAREHGGAALAAFQAFGDARGQAQTLLELGNLEIYSPRGNLAQAERHLMSALKLSETIGGPEFRTRVHIVLANLYGNRLGDIKSASRHWEAVEAQGDSITDPHIHRSSLMLRAWFTLYQLADYRVAEDLFQQASALARKIHDPATVVYANYGLAQVLYFEGKIEEACQAFERCALEMADSQVVPGSEIEALWMVAECSLRLGDGDGFARVVAAYHDSARSAGVATRPIHARVLEGLNCVFHGDRAGCESAFAEAFRLIETHFSVPDPPLVGLPLFFYGVALRAFGSHRRGKAQIRQAFAFLVGKGLHAQLAAFRQADNQLVEFLRRASATVSPGSLR